MKHFDTAKAFPAVLAALLLSACQGGREGAPRLADSPADDADSGAAPAVPMPTSPGERSAPIKIDYSIMGNPVVGQPVGINLQISSTQTERAIALHYRVDEVGSLTFPESQAASAELMPPADAAWRSQQVTVVPQREGRVYLVVAAEIANETGTLTKSMAIPIQVARAPAAPDSEVPQGSDGSQ